MDCPECAGPAAIYHTRRLKSGRGVTRLRRCAQGHSFATFEHHSADGLRDHELVLFQLVRALSPAQRRMLRAILEMMQVPDAE